MTTKNINWLKQEIADNSIKAGQISKEEVSIEIEVIFQLLDIVKNNKYWHSDKLQLLKNDITYITDKVNELSTKAENIHDDNDSIEVRLVHKLLKRIERGLLKNFKLTYTKEMEEQDKLWDAARDDTEVMAMLQRQIIDEAEEEGWEGHAVIWEADSESIMDVADTEEEHIHGSYVASFGCCKPALKHIEMLVHGTVINNEHYEVKLPPRKAIKRPTLVNKKQAKARKARLWDTKYRSMGYQFFISAQGVIYERSSTPGSTKNIEIQQASNSLPMEHVGKDVLGKDIYTNDIVTYYDESEGLTKFAIVHYDDEKFGYAPMCFGHVKDLKVIGNVYENEELIDMIDS